MLNLKRKRENFIYITIKSYKFIKKCKIKISFFLSTDFNIIYNK